MAKIELPEFYRASAIIAVTNLRMAESGGCFNPIRVRACSPSDCYCQRQVEREVDAVLHTVSIEIIK